MDLVKILGGLLNSGALGIDLNASRNPVNVGRSNAPFPAAAAMTGAHVATGPCPCCNGQGAFDTWGSPCVPGHMHEKMKCPTCRGQRVLPAANQWIRCPQCEGKGAFNHWDKPCLQADMHFKSECPTCRGAGYFPPTANAYVPSAIPMPGAPVGTGPCPCCGGKGAFDVWGHPCDLGHMHEKMKCPTCRGQRVLPAANQWTRCPQCEGKGAFNHWSKPCLKADMHFKSDCQTCSGAGYLPPALTLPSTSVPPQLPWDGWLGGVLGAALGLSDSAPQFGSPSSSVGVDSRTANDQAAILIRAMLNAARCDGRIDANEQARIAAALPSPTAEERRFFEQELARPFDMEQFAASVPLGLEEQVYTVSLNAIDLDSPAEAEYLRRLARALRLSPEVCQRSHQRLGKPIV